MSVTRSITRSVEL